MKKQNAEALAKAHDLETSTDYYNSIFDSLVNGQRQQLRDFFNAMLPHDQNDFLNNYCNHDGAQLYGEGFAKSIRNICITELTQ